MATTMNKQQRHGLIVCKTNNKTALEGYYQSSTSINWLFSEQLKYRGGFDCNLLDRNPTPVQIRIAVENLCEKLKENSTSIGLFYYCGDGNTLKEEIDFEKDVVEPLALVKNSGSIIILDTVVPPLVELITKKYPSKIYCMCSSKPGSSCYVSTHGGHFSISLYRVLSSPYSYGKNLKMIQDEINILCKNIFPQYQTPVYSEISNTFEKFCFVTTQPIQLCSLCDSPRLQGQANFNCLEENCRLVLCDMHASKHDKNHILAQWKNGVLAILKKQ